MKNLTIVLTVILISSIIGVVIYFVIPKNSPLKPDLGILNIPKTIKPSETNIEYTDESGFSFSYPDNLSITKAEIEDPNTYADLQLYSKEISGSLNLKIADSKLKSLDDWLRANKISSASASAQKKLGNLKALEIKTPDRLMLGSLDQGVLFTIEMPLIEQDFWDKVYERVLSNFTFVQPDLSNAAPDSYSDVVFEGEEVVE